ncbi:MAG: PKD domain-containing protein, partial [Thermoplasmata archaeon]
GTATDIDDDSLIYNWSFGDNSTNVTGQNVKHAYDKAGQFIVILTVDDGHGHVVTEELTISVGERPIAGLDIILTFVLVVVALALIALVMRRVFRDVENK